MKLSLLNRKKDEPISYFAKSLSQEGKIRFKGTLRIDGEFIGEIEGFTRDITPMTISDLLIVGKNGTVKGKVHVARLIVEGLISGVIVVTEKTEILSSGSFVGSLETPVIRVEEGAAIGGSINDIKKAEDHAFRSKLREAQAKLGACEVVLAVNDEGEINERRTSEATV